MKAFASAHPLLTAVPLLFQFFVQRLRLFAAIYFGIEIKGDTM
jgi:hypothetical protein